MRILDGVDVARKSRAIHEEQQLLTSKQQEMLVRWIPEAEQTGHAFNHAQFREMTSIINRASGGTGTIGKNWTARFLQQHPQIQTKKAATIAGQ